MCNTGERAKRARHSQVCSVVIGDLGVIVRMYVIFSL